MIPATDVHSALAVISSGKTPNYSELTLSAPVDVTDKASIHGWRLENFVADEVLRCRQGKVFDDFQDPNLQQLFYERSAPITAAISITVDFASG